MIHVLVEHEFLNGAILKESLELTSVLYSTALLTKPGRIVEHNTNKNNNNNDDDNDDDDDNQNQGM